MYLSKRHWLRVREPVRATRRTRACSVQVCLLEGRLLLSGDMVAPSTTHQVVSFILDGTQTRTLKTDSATPIVTASANPSSLWPPNHKFVSVTVRGHVYDASGGVPRAVSYRVIDEYALVQPSGTARVHRNGTYSFIVQLQSSRLGQDKDGRLYTIVVSATDRVGNTGSATTFVVVPHDQGHHGSDGHGNGNDGDSNGNHGHGNGGDHGHGQG